MFTTFDAPSGEACVAAPRSLEHAAAGADAAQRRRVRRSRAGARATDGRDPRAARPATTSESPHCFRRCLTRPPSERRTGDCCDVSSRTAQHGSTGGELDAAAIAGPGDGDAIDRAAWTLVARALLNLDETDHQRIESMSDTPRPFDCTSRRRHFFATAASASARSPLSSLLAGSSGAALAAAAAEQQPVVGQSACSPKPPHFPPKAKRGHPPVHGRRAEPARSVRLQAEARRSSKASRSRPRSSAASATPSSAPTRRCSGRGSSSPSTASAARSCPRCCRTWPRSSTTSASSSRSTPTSSITPGADLLQHRLLAAGPAEPRLVGHCTASAPRRSDLPAFVVMSHRRGHQRRRGQLVERLPADASTPACGSATRAIRFSNVTSPRRHRPPKLQRDTLDLVGSAESPAARQAVGDPEIATRIASYEMAFRLQTSAPELMDLEQRIEGDARPVRLPIRTSRRSPAPACSRGG